MINCRSKLVQLSPWLALILGQVAAQDGTDADVLQGIGIRESDDYNGYTYLSLMGGAEMFVKADGGFNDQAGANILFYKSTQIEDTLFIGPPLTQNDGFKSNPSEGRLAFTTPAPHTLLNQEDFSFFDGSIESLPDFTNIQFYLEVSNPDSDDPTTTIQCETTNNCRFQFRHRYTPLIHAIVPNQIYKDHPVDWTINIQAAHQVYPSDKTFYEELSVDKVNNYFEYLDDNDEDEKKRDRLTNWRLDRIQAYMGDQKPNKSSVPRARFMAGDSFIRKTARHCNFAGDECWTIRTHARIDSISASSGYTNGGQELTITGWGFEENVAITVAGIDCVVQSMSDKEVTCITGEAAGPSVDGVIQAGQPGIRRRKYNPDYGTSVYFANMLNEDFPVSELTHELVLESVHDYDYKYGQNWDGFFSPPETGNYRFYISCDDPCKLLMDITNPLSAEVEFEYENVAFRNYVTNWRNYLEPPEPDEHQYQSDWIALTQGELYAMQSLFENGGGPGHMTTSVEFETDSAAGHPMAMKETQVFTLMTENRPETWKIIIENPSDGEYKLVFQEPETLDLYETDNVIRADASANTLRNEIYYPYYRSRVGATNTVTKTSFDADGVETDVTEDIVTVEYKIELDKRINGMSFASIQVLKDPDNTSTITVIRPDEEGGLLSSEPLGGRFILSCPDPDYPDVLYETSELTYSNWSPGIEVHINDVLDVYRGKVYVKDFTVLGQKYHQNARQFAIQFIEFEKDVPQCTIKSGVNTPISGENVTLTSETLFEYGESLFFEPIPMEFMFTPATQPQVLVEVDGVPAACVNLDCDYLYEDTTALITGATLDGLELSITGIDLPLDLLNVRLGDVSCGPTTAVDATSIVCTLKKSPAAGVYNSVEVLSADGLVPIQVPQARRQLQPSLITVIVPLTITAVSPATDLNRFGGDTLTITGTGFPQSIDDVTVTFSDTSSCTVVTTSSTSLTCTVDGFTTINEAEPTYTFTVAVTTTDVNTEVDSDTVTVTISSTALESATTTLTPNSLSPVLRQNLVINFTNDFALDLTEKGRFIVYLVGVTDATYRRDIFIRETDDQAKTMTLTFNGAPSGEYRLYVQSLLGGLSGGNIGMPELTLTTVIAVDTITPMQGSVLGGTLLTITGQHFGLQPTDNPVKVGENYCEIITTADSLITCRILVADGETQVAATADVIVFAKTSEEMVCNIDSTPSESPGDNDEAGCVFEYMASTTTVTDITAALDSGNVIISVTGTGFSNNGGDTTNTELYIDGVKTTALTVTDVLATFQLDYALDTSPESIVFYTAEGLPSGELPQVIFVPYIASITPTVGSTAGTIAVVTGAGFGVNTTGLNILSTSLVTSICTEVVVIDYGVFTCELDGTEIPIDDTLSLIQTVNSQGTILNELDQIISVLNAPVIATATKTSETTIQLSDITDGPTAVDYPNVECEYQGLTTTVRNVNTIDCVFEPGIPYSDDALTVTVTYLKEVDTDVYAKLSADTSAISLANPLTVTDSALAYDACSFAGGCPYTLTGNGLAGAFKADPDNNYINVCQQECVVDWDASDASNVVCTVPPLATSFSGAEYGLAMVDRLPVTWMGDGSNPQVLSDGVNTKDYNASGACLVTTTALNGYVFQIEEIKIFLNNLLDKSPYIDGNLTIQGSNDSGVTWDDIYSYDETIHEGWNEVTFFDSPLDYSSIRFQGAGSGSCRIGEIKLIGIEVVENDSTSVACPVDLYLDGTPSEEVLATVQYSQAKTLTLDTIAPRYGSVLGGETVTFTGTFVAADQGVVATITIDNRPCNIVLQSETALWCDTADKPYVPGDPELRITFTNYGDVATFSKVYRYVSRWSDNQTWGEDLPPQKGEAVNIPSGLQLLVDVPSTPVLSFVLVEGSLIFPSDVDESVMRTFDTNYIFVNNGGYLEIGTEDDPFMSKLTITMHGNEQSPALPTYGNKVIGVRFGQLEMHGKPRSIVWTDLKSTAEVDDTTIEINDVTGDPLDWQVGEYIVIASTDFDGTHAEKRMITAVGGTELNPVLTLDSALLYKHYAGVQTFGTETIEMRAEVGLLSRNVVYRGDPETTATNQYGAHIMLHSPGDESVIGKIENCEFFDVGQAFKLGRYPIHFHMIGTVTQSYIKKNSIHQTYNRATTLHGVHYLEISGNVAYRALGHTIFIEDAIETKNLILNNLVIDTRASNSLLNTDQSPACFWITNPDNIFRGNHAAGSDRYGYWFDLQETSTGPSFDPNICPENTKLGEFSDNVAHSVGRYGLRIFHNLIPRTFPCKPLNADLTNEEDPYASNPVIPAQFYRYLGYKANRNGAIAERVGAVEFHDFKTADNILAGIEFSLTEDVIDGYAKVVNGVVIGRTENTEALLDSASPHGIIAPRTEGFTVDGTKFFSYDWNEAAAFGDCSHCFHAAATDSGARTYTVRNLEFTDVTRRIKYQYPERGIFYDKDGSLTGLGPETYATKGYPHVDQSECTMDTTLYDGVVCDDTVTIRRIVFYGYEPSNFRGQNINILKWDRDIVDPLEDAGTLETYVDTSSNYSKLFWKSKLKPTNAWAVPYVTGHKYRITWGNVDLDYTTMLIQKSEKWTETDENVLFMIPFVDAREAINVTDTRTGEQIAQDTLITTTTDSWEMGYNFFQNATEVREFLVVVNGKNTERDEIKLRGLQCISGVCPQDEVDVVPINDDQTFWSDPATWPNGDLPVEGQDVIIEPYMNVVLNIDTPVLNLLTVNGRLSFYDADEPVSLNAKQVYVRAGELLIGSEETPYEQTATITLYGERDEATEVMSGSIETGNKLLLNTGLIKFVGAERSRESRLRVPVYKGETTAFVEAGLDWKAGDQIYLAPTNLQWLHSDYSTIVSYDPDSGIVEVEEPFEYYHYGAGSSTSKLYSGVDIRGEVRLLSRNIKVIGAPTPDNWGGNILTLDRIEFDGTFRKATTQFDYVEVSGCSQQDTFHAAIRFENTGQSKANYLNNTVVHDSEAWSLYVSNSRHVMIKNSDFIGSKAVGVNFNSVIDVHLRDSFVADVRKREWDGKDKSVDKEACVAFCSYFEPNVCADSTVRDTIAAGCAFAGFVAPGHDCDDTKSRTFYNNVAHSGERNGAHIYPDPGVSKHANCYEGSNFSAYKNRECGLSTMYSTKDLRMRDMVFIDNQLGVSLQTAGERESINISMTDVEIYGEGASEDCPDGQDCYCPEKFGLMLFSSNFGGKPLHPESASQLPIHKIKSYGAWGGYANLNNVNFNRFETSETACGARQSAIGRNPTSSDYIPPHKFKNTSFRDVTDDAIIYIDDPNPGWANPTDCVDWPCTAPENVVLYFEETTYSGTFVPLKPVTTFQIVSDVEKAVRAYDGCTLKPAWSAALCQNRNLGILLFESLDADTEDRTVSPVIISNDKSGYVNELNSMMDHVWDGFYTGQKRLSRFPGQIETDQDYELKFSGTPPGSMRFVLRADTGAIKFRIYYPNAGSYSVTANGEEIDYTPWDKNLGRHGKLSKLEGCGENRFVGVENFLEFYLTTDCEIRVQPKDSISISVRLDWTLDEFYASGGYTAFVDRVAAVLGVNASQVKTVAIYEGSVIIDYFIEPEPKDKEPQKTLDKVSKKFFKAVDDGVIGEELGAPIIGVSAELKSTVELTYDGYKPLEGNLWDYILEERAKYESQNGETDFEDENDPDTGFEDERTYDDGTFVWTPPVPEEEPELEEVDQDEGEDQEEVDQEGGVDTDDQQETTDQGEGSGQETITTDEQGYPTNVEFITEPLVMSETMKYFIGLFFALVIALLFACAYLMINARDRAAAARPAPVEDTDKVKIYQQFELQADDTNAIFSSKKRKLKGTEYLSRPSSPVKRNIEGSPIQQKKIIYVPTEDDQKDIFTGQRKKVNMADNVAELTFTGHVNQEVILFAPDPDEPLETQGNQLLTEHDLIDTTRALRPSSSRLLQSRPASSRRGQRD